MEPGDLTVGAQRLLHTLSDQGLTMAQAADVLDDARAIVDEARAWLDAFACHTSLSLLLKAYHGPSGSGLSATRKGR